jgi:Uncharacterized protein conserved in bacteria
MSITYDPVKRIANIAKHGIDFADIEAVFDDPMALVIEDHDHSEQRFVVLGCDGFGRVLVVCYSLPADNVIRVISARKAQPHERRQYEE